MDKSYNLSANSLFHCLRHFNKLCRTEKELIEAEGRTKTEINAMLAQSGSKFFADSVAEIIDSILAHTVKTETTDGKTIFHALFGEPVGFTGIVSEDELNNAMRAGLQEEMRGSYAVRTVPSDTMSPTCEAHLILDTSTKNVITVFPGSYAPAIPRQGWSASPFWSSHYFIRLT